MNVHTLCTAIPLGLALLFTPATLVHVGGSKCVLRFG